MRRAFYHTFPIVPGFVDKRAKVCNLLEIKLLLRSWRFIAEQKMARLCEVFLEP